MNKASWKRRAKQAEQYAHLLEVALKHEQEHQMARVQVQNKQIKELEARLRNHTPLVTTNFEALAKERWESVAREWGDEILGLRKQIRELEKYRGNDDRMIRGQQARIEELEKQIDALKEEYNLLWQENRTLEKANDKPE